MIVVADTSVLINLCRVGEEDLLVKLFREVVIPPEVGEEFIRLACEVSRFQGLSLPQWVRQHSASAIPEIISAAPGLDPGETAALSLALEIQADAILVDERRGQQVAAALGLATIGILGILLQAKTSGLLSDLRPVLDRLEREAQFWISASLRDRVLRLARE